jgi:hypothetical protein
MKTPVFFNGVALDAPCPQCKGKGTTPTGHKLFSKEPKDEDCNVCNGCGHQPTEDGRRLLVFITRYVTYHTDGPGDWAVETSVDISPPPAPRAEPEPDTTIKPEPSNAIGWHPTD